MKRKHESTGPGDAEIRRLLERYDCHVPFHAVRTRFLGNIATPEFSVSPMRVVEGLWGGALPVFESEHDLNELMGGLVMGLWNRLAEHQDRKRPFRLTRIEPPRDTAGVAHVARIRLEELDGFVDGLFGDAEALDLPKRAHEALNRLAEIRSFMNAFIEFSDDPELERDLKKTVQNVMELSRIAEQEINAAVLSCTRARRQMLDAEFVERPTRH